MLTRLAARALRLVMPMLLLACSSAALAQSEQQKVVNLADQSLINFLRDPQMTWLQENIGKAKGILIASNVVKAGFIFGGSGGRAVLIVRDPATGKWNGPAFYTLATASVGFQAGVSVSEIVTLVMTEKGMRSLLATSVKLGGEASVAAGPVGAGAAAEVVSDLVSFSRAKGVYGGVNLDGTVVYSNVKWNDAYYGGNNILPPDIIIRRTARTPRAAPLLNEIANATR